MSAVTKPSFAPVIARYVFLVREELDGPSCMSGYRAMWHTLRLKYGLCIPRSTVQSLLKEVDPVGTEERRKHRLKRRTYSSNGPNECWHVDGYDKLKPFGFPIHGAVDGYSHRILWFKVTPSNDNYGGPQWSLRIILQHISNYYVRISNYAQHIPISL